jgi:hypothetical protein
MSLPNGVYLHPVVCNKNYLTLTSSKCNNNQGRKVSFIKSHPLLGILVMFTKFIIAQAKNCTKYPIKIHTAIIIVILKAHNAHIQQSCLVIFTKHIFIKIVTINNNVTLTN